MDGKSFGFLPSLYGADFPVQIVSNLFPGIEFPVIRAREMERVSASRHEGRRG
jgi:hypothetical protein